MPGNLSAIFGSSLDGESEQPSFIAKVILWISAIVSVVLMSWLARAFSIPGEPGFSGSLLQQDGWLVSILVVVVGMVAVMLVSAVLSSSLRSESPVFCTALACAVISWRGGTMQATLFAASGPGIFITLALETAILFAALIGAWQLLQNVRGRSAVDAAVNIVAELDDEDDQEGLDEKLLAMFTQASVMMALMILLCRSDAKTQSLASVGISSAVAAAVAVQLVKVRSAFWLWIGPLAVAVFGYAFASIHAEGWQVGVLHGPLAALARPLPLDYVSMGPAGAILGYWMSGGGGSEEVLPDKEPS